MSRLAALLTRPIGIKQSASLAAAARARAPLPYGFDSDSEAKQLGLTRDLLEAYRDNAWVFGCVSSIADAMAQSPLKLYQGAECADDDETEIPTHPLRDLWRKPNPHDRGRLFRKQMYIDMELAGNWYAEIVYEAGTPVALYRMRPDKMSIVVDKNTGEVAGYLYRPGQSIKPVPFAADDVWHRRHPNPLDDYRGMSPLQAAKQAVRFDYGANDQMVRYFENGLRISGLLTGNEEADADTIKMVQLVVDSRHKGSRNAHKVMVLPGVWNYTDVGGTPKDADWIEGKRMSREEICAVFNVPPPVAGDFTRSTYSNYEEADRDFWQGCIAGKYADLDEDVSEALLPLFSGGDGQHAHHDLSETPAEKKDANADVERAVKAYTGSIWTLNEARAESGKDPIDAIPDADEQVMLLANTYTQIPADFEPPEDPNEPPEPGDPDYIDATAIDVTGQALLPSGSTPPQPAGPSRVPAGATRTPGKAEKQRSPAEQTRHARLGPIIGRGHIEIRRTMRKQRDDLLRHIESGSEMPFKADLGSRRGSESPGGDLVEDRSFNSPADHRDPARNAEDTKAINVPTDLIGRINGYAWAVATKAFEVTVRKLHVLAGQEAYSSAAVAGVEVSYALEDPLVVERLRKLADRPDGIGSITGTQKQLVLDEVQRGIQAGAPIDTIVHGGAYIHPITGEPIELDGITGVYQPWTESNSWKAERVARTETGVAYNTSAVDAYRSAGFRLVEVHDGDGDAECAALNGTIQTLDWAEQNPLAHPQCRRALAPHVEAS